MKKPMGTRRDVQQPYLIVVSGDWTWRALKAYTSNPDAPFARWYAAVKTPYTGGSWSEGDTYIRDITGTLVYVDPEVPAEALPKHLRTQLYAAIAAAQFGKTSSIHTMPETVR